MSQHTPGPWHWTWQEERTCYALKSDKGQVLEITKGLTPIHDDQRLIATAPELLAALEAFTLAADAPHRAPARSELLMKARAAIAKAKEG